MKVPVIIAKIYDKYNNVAAEMVEYNCNNAEKFMDEVWEQMKKFPEGSRAEMECTEQEVEDNE